MQLPQPAVNQNHIRIQLLAFGRMTIPPRNYLPNRRVIIHALHRLDPKPSIPILEWPPINETNQRAHHLLALNVRNVYALHAPRRRLQSQQIGQLLQSPPRIGIKNLRLHILAHVA